MAAFECTSCAGHWLRFGDYLAWRDRQLTEQPEIPSEEASESEPATATGVRRCPDCAYLLTRYSVGHGVPFFLDRCGHCNGVWFDPAEWNALRARGLHDNIHQIFGVSWQAAIRTAEGERRTEERFAQRLGSDAERVRTFAEWVNTHPRRNEILAYVQSHIR